MVMQNQVSRAYPQYAALVEAHLLLRSKIDNQNLKSKVKDPREAVIIASLRTPKQNLAIAKSQQNLDSLVVAQGISPEDVQTIFHEMMDKITVERQRDQQSKLRQSMEAS